MDFKNPMGIMKAHILLPSLTRTGLSMPQRVVGGILGRGIKAFSNKKTNYTFLIFQV